MSGLHNQFMPRHLYSPVGQCIYCGRADPASGSRFTDEHIIPLSLGGNLILPQASCTSCAKIINGEIENRVTGQEWGYLRSKREFPTRNKKKRKTHIQLAKLDGSPLKVPIRDYSSPVLLYLFGEARILSGLEAEAVRRWDVRVLTDHDAEMEMKRKYPEWDQQHALRVQPHEFARMIAKIGYGYAVAEMGHRTFRPLVTDIILGRSDDYFHAVGGTHDIAPPVPGGDHLTEISILFKSPIRALIIVGIRLFSSIETPSYHAVVGEIDLTNPFHTSSFEAHRSAGKLSSIGPRAI